MVKSPYMFTFCICFILCLNACTTLPNRAVSSKVLQQPEEAIDNMLILFTEYHDEISKLDEENYNRALKGKFNNLEYQRFRNHMADTAWDIFFPLATYDYRKLFDEHNEYTFVEFEERLQGEGVDYILLINLKVSEPVGEVIRRVFQVYLIDKNTGTQIWSGFGYHNPGNMIRKPTARRLLRNIKKDLASAGMI